jgi:hypothetical protein
MDNSGEVAERVVKLSMDGAVATAKITGIGAKHLAILLHTTLSDQNKTSGKVKLAAMLKSGKELKVFSLTEENLKQFAAEAKRYGVTYCALRDRNPQDGHPIELMARAEDSAKIERIFERLKFGDVDINTIETEIERSLEEAAQNPPEQVETADIPNRGNEIPIQKEGDEIINPFAVQTEKSPPFVDTSKRRETEGKDLNSSDKKSVRKEIKEIRKDRANRKAPDKDKSFTDRMDVMQKRERELTEPPRPRSPYSRDER